MALTDFSQVDENGQGIPLDKLDALLDYGHEGSAEEALGKLKVQTDGASPEGSDRSVSLYDRALYGHYGHGLNLSLMYLGERLKRDTACPSFMMIAQ